MFTASWPAVNPKLQFTSKEGSANWFWRLIWQVLSGSKNKIQEAVAYIKPPPNKT